MHQSFDFYSSYLITYVNKLHHFFLIEIMSSSDGDGDQFLGFYGDSKLGSGESIGRRRFSSDRSLLFGEFRRDTEGV